MSHAKTGDELRRIAEENRQRIIREKDEAVQRKRVEKDTSQLVTELIESCLLLANNTASMGGRSVTLRKWHVGDLEYRLFVGAIEATIRQLATRGITVRSETQGISIILFISW
jgi:hypothetical protein